jgi:hypothetical protein
MTKTHTEEMNAARHEQAAGRERRAGLAGGLNMHAPGEDVDAKARYRAAKGLTHATDAEILTRPSPLQAMLDERGSRYGKFVDHAECTQAIKQEIYKRLKGKTVKADQIEALEMIAHKIGRIVCGDPDFEVSWRDIAGYATLVADRLKGEER